MIEEIVIVLIAMTPLAGIRAAIPVAVMGYEMTIPAAYFLSVLGEFIPVFIILAFLGVVSQWLSHNFSFMRRFFDFLFEKTRRDYNGRVHKYGIFALFLFTGIPLPFSGAWTASLVVFLFGLPYWKSVFAIFCGILLAGINILIIMEMGIAVEKYHGPLAIAGFVALVSLIYFLYYRRNNNKKMPGSENSTTWRL